MKKARFINYLQNTLMPDIMDSGKKEMAEDFKILNGFLKGSHRSYGRSMPEFIDYLQSVLIPGLRESGEELTALDFETGIKLIQGTTENPMTRKKLDPELKKVKINITVDAKHLAFLEKIGPTVSEAVRKVIDEAMALKKKK